MPNPTAPSGMDTPSRLRVLVVDDDATIRRALAALIARDGYDVQSVASGEEALKALNQDLYDIVLLDLDLPGMGGLDVLAVAPSLQSDAQFIVLTGLSSVATAVEAIKLGAFDYIA